jgi:general stress protein YciG
MDQKNDKQNRGNDMEKDNENKENRGNDNPGNFANDPNRAREAGREGGKR